MDRFFGLTVPVDTPLWMGLALLLSVVLGGLIGLERELHGHPAGLRTHILVAVGATLLTLVSVNLVSPDGARSDPGRIAAQIVVGIGFLGAGAIIREGASIRGLTTAASIWTTAAIGLAVGAGPLFGGLAVFVTLVVLFTLFILHQFEDALSSKGLRMHRLEIEMRDSDKVASSVLGHLMTYNVQVGSLKCEASHENRTRQVVLQVRLPKKFDRGRFLADLADQPGLLSASLD